MLEFCKNRRADVLRFTTGTSVWPTNNTQRARCPPPENPAEISGRLHQRRRHPDRLDIRGYIDTAASTASAPTKSCTSSWPETLGCPQPSQSPRNTPIKTRATFTHRQPA